MKYTLKLRRTSRRTNAAVFKLRRTERGWAGHFVRAHRCHFRRNTLLEYGAIKVVVSTVGLMEDPLREGMFATIGHNRHFETMAFHAAKDGRYWDADVSRELTFRSPWAIANADAEDLANDMHEIVVTEITQRMMDGELAEVNLSA
jgi:hypothetical protein